MISAQRCGYYAMIAIVAGSLALGALSAPAENASLVPTDRPSRWASNPQRLEEALGRRDVNAAKIAWHDAYGTAFASRSWEGLIAVGDAALRIGDAARDRRSAQPIARRLYLHALFRARQQRSLEGVLRATDAFAVLGDQDVVAHGLRMAEQLSESMQDLHARERVDHAGHHLLRRHPVRDAHRGHLRDWRADRPAARPSEKDSQDT